MAKSKYEYVKQFEADHALLPHCWIVVRIDGKGFHRLSDVHKFQKPNDERALKLMNAAAEAVMQEFGDIVLAFGQSDEYSFVLPKSCQLYRRRESKIVSVIVSLFTANYVLKWPTYVDSTPLAYAPSFDGRAVLYPSDESLRDYLSWRQVDTHINNLFNTTFWSLVVSGGMTEKEAMRALNGTRASDKNEILFSRFGINYSTLPEMYRKGTTLVRKVPLEEPTQTRSSVLPGAAPPPASASPPEELAMRETSGSRPFSRKAKGIVRLNVDIIGDQFWAEHPQILAD